MMSAKPDWASLSVTVVMAKSPATILPTTRPFWTHRFAKSSPSRIGNDRRFLREKLGVGKKATQKTTHSPIRMIPQEVAPGPRAVFGKGPRQRTRLPGTR
jgi:hypothetical protein